MSKRAPLFVLAFLAVPLLAQEVSNEVKHDSSPPLSTLQPALAPAGPEQKKVRPIELNPNRLGHQANLLDPVEQTSAGPVTTSVTMLSNFAGIGKGLGSFAVSSVPPDTTGAVGETQFVQAVNTSLAVFDKATGALKFGPVPIKRIWLGFGTACETQNDGDPIVRYDSLAKRWIITQFQVTTGHSQCVAVSQTPDALGRYNRYEFKYPAFNDYPKLGVWPDAYYITFNMFEGLSGARACAYEREKMLAGTAARQVCFQLGSNFFSLMPGDVDGRNAPPGGAANPMLALGSNSQSLDLWRFHVDWTTPTASTFGVGSAHTPNGAIPVASFNDACGGGTCVPQPGTAQKLDSLGERLMMRAAYRRFADHDALVVTHNVAPSSAAAGVRWYEIRGILTTPTVTQQGTFSPDANSRWMGSAAMDAGGNLLVGYSVSSGSVKPSIRVAGRTAVDTAGMLGPETGVIAGTGVETDVSRWGDYSELSVDPTDDCTLWFTTEYMKESGKFNWSTRIASFRFPTCTAPPPPPPASDARRIVFTSTRDGNREIYSIRADGTDLRRLTNNAASDSAPAVSADGQKIVFVSDRDGAPALYIMNMDGSDVHRLTPAPGADDMPQWVPGPSSELTIDAPAPAAVAVLASAALPPGDPPDEVWGGDNALLHGTTIEFGCADGRLDAPLPPSGAFDIPGTFTRRHPGPTRDDEPSAAPQPARYMGNVSNGTAALTVRLASGQIAAEATLVRGRVTRVVRCATRDN
jgi:hypothetical protein